MKMNENPLKFTKLGNYDAKNGNMDGNQIDDWVDWETILLIPHCRYYYYYYYYY